MFVRICWGCRSYLPISLNSLSSSSSPPPTLFLHLNNTERLIIMLAMDWYSLLSHLRWLEDPYLSRWRYCRWPKNLYNCQTPWFAETILMIATWWWGWSSLLDLVIDSPSLEKHGENILHKSIIIGKFKKKVDPLLFEDKRIRWRSGPASLVFSHVRHNLVSPNHHQQSYSVGATRQKSPPLISIINKNT